MTPDTNIIAALASNPTALLAYIQGCAQIGSPEVGAVVEADEIIAVSADPTKSITRKARAKKAAPAPAPTGKRTKRERPASDVWTVRKSWKGKAPKSTTLAASCLFHGMAPVAVAKVQGDQYALSMALGTLRIKQGAYKRIEEID